MAITGTPAKGQRISYLAIHTSVNGHSVTGAVNHLTGGRHIGMEDEKGLPIGKPSDAYVQNHPANGGPETWPSSRSVNAGRASRQSVNPNISRDQFWSSHDQPGSDTPTQPMYVNDSGENYTN